MPDTDTARVNNLSWNEPNQFIFIYHRGCPIGDINITGVDKDASDNKKNQSPQDPTHELQATEDSEEDPVIPDNSVSLNIKHEKPTEKVHAT